MNSFIPWVGGKSKLLWIINKMAPDHYSRFIDVFGGSGTVTMSRPIQQGCMVDGDYKTKAYASVTIAGAFAVHGLRVIETDKGRFISMPQESYKKNGETVYNDTFHAVTAEARTALVDAVNDAYEQKLQERMEQSEDAPAHGMEQQM